MNPLMQEKIDPKIESETTQFIANGMKIVYNEAISKGIIDRIKKTQDPIAGVSDATLNIVDKIERAAAQSGPKVNPGVVAHGAYRIMEEILELAESTGIPKMTDEEKYQTYSMVVSKYIDDALKTGKMTKEEVMQYAEELKQTKEGQKVSQEMGSPMGQPPLMGGQNG